MAHAEVPPFQNPLERIGHTVREIPAWAGKHWKSLTLTLAALGGAGYVSIQLARPYTPDTQAKTTVPVSDTLKPADPGAGSEVVVPAIPTEAPPTATASPTPEPPKPTPTEAPPTPTAEPTKAPTATPEAKKDEPCTILPQEYCSQADRIEYKTALGITAKMIGIKVPEGKLATTPIKGQVAPTKLNDDVIFFKGFQVYIFDPNNPKRQYILTGDIQPNDMLTRNMNKGESFGHTTNTGVDMLGYNLIFYVVDIGPDNRGVYNEEIMGKMFSEAYAKPPIQAAAPEGTAKGGGTIYINTFSEKPK